MKAAIYYGPRDIRIEEIERPTAGDDGVVVRVRAAGVCGGDVHAYKQIAEDRPPGILAHGHENAGEVVEVGANVKDVKVGDRVFAEGLLPCFECEACKSKDYMRCTRGLGVAGLSRLHGGFAEYLWVPVVLHDPNSGALANLFKLPDTMSYQDGALVEPMGVGAGTARNAQPEASDLVVVVGTGIVGLGALVSLKAAGVEKLIASDVSDKRLQAAKELGADLTLNAAEEDVVKRVKEETAGRGADIVVEAAGLPLTFAQSIDMVRPGGKIVVVAFYEKPAEFKPHVLIIKNIKLIPGRGADFRGAFELMKAGKMKDRQVVSHTFPLHKIEEALETAMDSRESIKVMIEP